MATTDVDPRIERAFEALDARDAAVAAEQFADGGRYYEIPRDEVFTPTEFRAYLADEVFETFPDYHVEDRRVLTSAEWATTVEWSFGGTHEGDAGWFEPTGRTVSVPVVSVVTVSGDGISSWRDFFDLQGLIDRLGGA